MSDGTTRLKINMESGAVAFGSGQPGAPSADLAEDAALVNVKPYANMAEFISDTQSSAYKGDPLDPRPGNEYRRQSELRLLKMERIAAQRTEATLASVDDATYIASLDTSIPHVVAQLAVERGPFLTREQRQAAYSAPEYKTSADFRAVVAARDAITPF